MSIGPPSNRAKNRGRSGHSRAISPALIDSDEEYERFCFPLPALSFDNHAPPQITVSSRSNRTRSKRAKNRQLAEKGVGTDNSGYRKDPQGPVALEREPPSASDDEEYFTAVGSDKEVEDILMTDTDTDPLPPPSRSSFVVSLRTSSSSFASTASVSSGSRTHSRKRGFEHSGVVADASNIARLLVSKVPRTSVNVATSTLQSAAQPTVVSPPCDIFTLPVLENAAPAVPSVVMPSALDISFIAHDPRVQALMDANDLSWGTQYEVARGVSCGRWTWEDISGEQIKLLKGSNETSAPKVDSILGRPGGGVFGVDDVKIWAELDREQAAIMEHQSRGLGLQGEWMGVQDWFGGQVQQVARIVQSSENSYHLCLEKMEMRKSHRFARYLGSRHMMQFKMPDKFDGGETFLEKKFILCGRTFVPFCAKDGNIYLLETNVDFERRPLTSQGDQYRVDFEHLIRWHNPMELNGNQSVNKWIARFDLGLSTSVPTLMFAPENIIHYPDDYAPHGDGKVPTEKIYSDGCGFMNGAALMAIARQLTGLGYDRDQRRPTAVQGRIFGAKGVWLLHPTDQLPEEPPRIWIRPSQIKVKLVPSPIENPGRWFQPWRVDQVAQLDPAQLIFDLVAPSRASVRTRLSRSTIMNLSHNRVPSHVLTALMRDSLEQEIQPLLGWTGPHSNTLLYSAVDRTGRVSLSRIQRQAAGSARALGLTRWVQDKDKDAEDTKTDIENPTNSMEESLSLHEKIIGYLQAGFSPLDNTNLYDDFRTAISKVIEKFVKEYRITIPESADAFLVPDPFGVLEEGQIHFKASHNLRDPLKYQYPDVLTGEVLIYRNPCRLPSDVQKVTAIQHAKLSEYVDVIVLPIKGAQSLASLLAGGDVDGDVGVCIFDPSLVEHFSTPPPCREPKNFMSDNFEPLASILTVAELQHRLRTMDSIAEAQFLLQRHLLSGFMRNYQIGKYSICHENAAYAFGYDNPITVRLGYMFNTILDSRKTGLVARRSIYHKDMLDYNRDPPDCMAGDRPRNSNSNRLHRQIKSPFILDELLREGKRLHAEHTIRYDHLKPGHDMKPDKDLAGPFRSVEELVKDGLLGENFAQELNKIKAHVEDCCRRGWLGIPWGLGTPGKHASAKQKQARERNNKTLRTVALEFALGPKDVPIFSKLGILEKVKASYTYCYKPKFAHSVAFTMLCTIKAEAQGLAPITRSVGQVMSVPSSAVRLFSAQAAEFGAVSTDIA